MIPLAGIWISSRYDHILIERSKSISTGFFMVIILTSYITGETSVVTYMLLITYILYVVIEAVYLMIYGRYLDIPIFSRIPTYREIEASILASIHTLYEFFRIAFGGVNARTWQELFLVYYNHRDTDTSFTDKYFMPLGLLGIPIFNLISIPSLFIVRYKPYRRIIIE